MCGFEAKLAFHILNKRQASDCDRFRPAIVAARQAVVQPLLNPLAVFSLKISEIRKPINSLKLCKSIMA